MDVDDDVEEMKSKGSHPKRVFVSPPKLQENRVKEAVEEDEDKADISDSIILDQRHMINESKNVSRKTFGK